MSTTKLLALAVCSVLIAACDRSSDQSAPSSTPMEVDANAPSTAQESTTTTAAEVPENINPAVVLEASPNPLDVCNGNKLGTVEVKWDVTAAAPSNFSIWVAAPGQKRKLWMSSKEITGTNKTGNWVRDQTKFSLVDDKGVVIATTTVSGSACTKADEQPKAPAASTQ